MGWGQNEGTPAGCTLPPLSTSQRITQQSIIRSASADLANAVRKYLESSTIVNLEALRVALEAFDESIIT